MYVYSDNHLTGNSLTYTFMETEFIHNYINIYTMGNNYDNTFKNITTRHTSTSIPSPSLSGTIAFISGEMGLEWQVTVQGVYFNS